MLIIKLRPADFPVYKKVYRSFRLKNFLFWLVFLLFLPGVFGFVLGYDWGWDRSQIDSCLVGLDTFGLNRLYFSSADRFMFNVVDGATGLYFPGVRRIVIYRNDEFCLILRHELCHLRQDLERRPFVEVECQFL